MPRVAIVIVTYNSARQISACLDALQGLDTDVVVVDNASSDDTRKEVVARQIPLIANDRNLGFGAAVNQGVRATEAPLILLLNPDAQLIEGLDSMAELLESSGAGAVGGLLLDSTGNPQTGFMARNLPTPASLIFEVLGVNHLWPSNPANWHYRCFALDHMTVAEVDQPAGAFLMFPRAVWEKLGGFAEDFWPIWFEDVDFCARLKLAGLKNYFCPTGVAKHVGAHSIDVLNLETREGYWYGSLLEYTARHFGSLAFRITCVAVVMGAFLRAVRAFPHFKFRALAVYGSIAGLALRRAFVSRRIGRATVV